jgi:hypothetical protein
MFYPKLQVMNLSENISAEIEIHKIDTWSGRSCVRKLWGQQRPKKAEPAAKNAQGPLP